MNSIPKKLSVLYLVLLVILAACQVKWIPAPTSTVVAEPIRTPSLNPLATQVSAKDGMVEVLVPAGEFRMGSTDVEIEEIYGECHDDMTMPCALEFFESEQPAHEVYLDSFWIDQTEVTNEKYQLCLDAGECVPLMSNESYTRDSYFGNNRFNNYPVVYVDWNMASAYCQWAGRRLPTEAEWEKAARGTEGRIYPWGNALPISGLLRTANDQDDTYEVGLYTAGASPYGALDMAGNVQEWTADWYDPEYYQKAPKDNPQGPATGELRSIRGSGWGDSTYYTIRTAARGGDDPDLPLFRYYLGFRCAASSSTP